MHHCGTTLLLALFAGLLLAGGCASTPVADAPGSARHREASDIAASMVGKPYRYGGNTPRGFDCSGLVQFSYKRAGMDVPRSTETQRGKSRKVSVSGLARGDLLFFSQEGKYSSHVGIYLGGKRFVHAPSSGKRVRVDSLADAYWQKHLVDARRF
ncbi:MAG TPA: C40 family peptidase [Acidiferrobacterales bacterium]|nr:C40 family peptidase [Acidiferrobacterales bacterium]